MFSASPITSEAGEGGGGQVMILNQNCHWSMSVRSYLKVFELMERFPLAVYCGSDALWILPLLHHFVSFM